MTDYIIGGEILTKRKLVTIDGSMVTTETGIPLALNIVLPNVKAAGSDVRLAELDGTPIAREIECIDIPSTDAVMLHYPFDTTADENSQFYIYWGNASLNEPAIDSTYGSEAVWSDYEAVWLMNEDPTGITTDRTGNGHDGTGYGFVSGDLINNTYGKRIDFDGTDAHIDMNRVTELEGVSETWTIGMYAAFDVAAANNCLFGYNADGSIDAGDIYAHYASATSTIKFGVGADEVDTTISDISDTEMHLIIFRHTATNALAYEDGVNKYDAVKGGTAASTSHTFKLGENYNVAYLNGKIGFAYIHPDSLSGNYITTQYKNQNNPTASGTDPFYLSRYDDSQIYSAKSNSSGIESTFLRRTSITRNHTGALTDYQQKYTIPYHVLMNTDFSDLRFNTQADGNGDYLEYWIESKTDSDTADVWVKSDYASGDDIIYIFYGNDGLTSKSNANNVFINFDDFEDALQGNWTTVFTPMNYAATGDYFGGIQSMQVGISGDRGGAKWGVAFEENVVISFMWKRTSTNPFKLIGGDTSTTIYVNWTGDILQYYDGAYQGSYSLPLATGWNKITIKNINFTANTYDICVGDDETVVYNDADMWASSDYNDFIEFFNDDTVGFGYVDNVYTRKYTTTEPTYTIETTNTPDKFSAVSDSDGNVSIFERRKPVKLTHAGVLTDYQYYETFDYEALMLDNFDDIRFVTQSGEHIPYWIETKTDGVSAKIWFMNDYIDGDTYIWMYYGSEGLSSESSGSDVFIVFDDFENVGADDWTTLDGTIDYDNTDHAVSGTQSMKIDTLSRTEIPVTASNDIIIEYQLWKKTAAVCYMFHSDTVWVAHVGFEADEDIAYYTTSWQDTGDNIVPDQWELITYGDFDWSAHTYDIVRNGIQAYNNAGMWNYGIRGQNAVELQNLAGDTIYIDNFKVRKYTAVEPIITVGAEQHLRTGNIMIL